MGYIVKSGYVVSVDIAAKKTRRGLELFSNVNAVCGQIWFLAFRCEVQYAGFDWWMIVYD